MAEETAATEEAVVAAESAPADETASAEEIAPADESVSAVQSAVTSAEAVEETTVAVEEEASTDEGEVTTLVAETVDAISVSPIVLKDAAASGDFLPDLKTDIGSVQDGLNQYEEKLGVAKSLLEKLKGGTQ